MESTISQYLATLFDQQLLNREGQVADYIPELAKVNADGFAISLATVDGNLYEIGDVATTFTIQSVSKPFSYALALIDNGVDRMSELIDVEPSGDPFNEISIDPKTGRPRNAMINAGAIAAAAQIRGITPDARFERVRAFYSECAGRELEIDETVFQSEVETGDRNRAIGYMLREFGKLFESPETALDTYMRQCSVLVTSTDLAMMAATLANGGCQPVCGARILPSDINRHVLSVMATCGMYNAAGDWLTNVGLPAKSGVGGGILAVLPGQCGIAIYSPRLDEFGNSVRAVAAFKQLSKELGLHFLNEQRRTRPAIRSVHDLREEVRRRPEWFARPEAVLQHGGDIQIVEMQGNLLFSGAETIERRLFSMLESSPRIFIVDMGHVDVMDEVARRMLVGLGRQLAARGVRIGVVDPERRIDTTQSLDCLQLFDNRREAVIWCETELLDAPR